MRPRRQRSQRKRRKRRERKRENRAHPRPPLNLRRRHGTEECQLLVHALARVEYHRDLLTSTRDTEEHKFLPGHDTGGRY